MAAMAKSFFFQQFQPNDENNRGFLDDVRRLTATRTAWQDYKALGDEIRKMLK